MLRKFILTGTLLFSTLFAISAMATDFTTIAQAQQHCPATNLLMFTPLSTSIPHSKGTISGFHNGVDFKNTSDTSEYMMHPKYLGSDHAVGDVSFRQVGDFYGYMSSNGVVTCLYSYPGFTGVHVPLVMRSTRT